jgi:hypothetical protein
MPFLVPSIEFFDRVVNTLELNVRTYYLTLAYRENPSELLPL